MAARPLIVGNWKMNGCRKKLAELNAIESHAATASAEVWMALPATLVGLAAIGARNITIGGQDVHFADAGAYTGSISAAMLREAGACFTLVGHSERRVGHGETGAVIRAKVDAAWRHGLDVVLCVGETAEQRNAGTGKETVAAQIRAAAGGPIAGGLAIAYEPVWCIGAPTAATPEQVAAMHQVIRGTLGALHGEAGVAVRLLYGGAVDPQSAPAILLAAEVDGVLAGRASLEVPAFCALINVASEIAA
ncbi:triose-phosphate isomerase [Sphingomonas sp. BT-65]|uniref:triose-phosphate isomerase n=1 Tax=Sphingomonas sp. BT-65 TaxID=2989821 RepID=UPI0022361E48|nr:triose-phosphate isomerase [Sphingomonas sp. BT-65]MCW4463497.1 triose-phosphate isomerase [Sphingomonas sp. BT-65]